MRPKMIGKLLTILTLLTLLLCSGPVQSRGLVRNLMGNSGIVAKAVSWENKFYRPGVSRQCANFVGEVMSSAGIDPPLGHSLARNWLKFGRPVYGSPRPGDVVITWRGSKTGNSGHILIYLGNGKCIHRPTQSRAVCKTELSYYQDKILGIRRK